MRWQPSRKLTVALGFLVIGPMVTILLAGTLGLLDVIGVGELLLGGVIGAAVGVYIVGRLTDHEPRPTNR